MTKIFLIRIFNQEFSCLGQQFANIIEILMKDIPAVVWYASDVDSIGDNSFISHYTSPYPQKIGSTEELLEFVKKVDQFLSGVFLAFPVDKGDVLSESFYTEDEPYRSIGEAILEIRPFDTSYFEVYSYRKELIKKLDIFFAENREE